VTFEFDDGRKVLVYPIAFGHARAGLINPNCALSIDDLW
jgi:hypothetical protein